ncbi:cysteine desulfurase [Williamwhitmania taraxaci]|uniref:Cysteine desulfurase n=1 Tax=Williamwhitmania taraxaci TaxID=1640674 RepID=A0A1G6PBP1_9BACT|nr:cysteine desulfurase [Williamwhitmania taraxaci]SDC77428.1 cysteine desulfurase /L-selenocysteine selenide-lyase (L-alanine-forming) [Williamwhitmania taraxaci]
MSLDINKVRADFPILSRTIHGKPLVYLDNGATAQKPLRVLDALDKMHRELNANIHRGAHFLSEQSTEKYEDAREVIRGFINAESTREIVFTAGTTAAINLVAFSFGEKFVKAGDEVVVSEMEHHSNIVPWQLMCERKGATLKVLPFDDNGVLRIDLLPDLLTEKVRILAVTQASNSLGTINPIKEIVALAHSRNIPVLIDGAQGIHHIGVDVKDIDCDFYAFSGHKIYGPTGIGVLYGKEKWLEQLPPYQGGGDMIATVTFAKTTYADLPLKFEAGTANYIGAVGLAEAIRYMQSIGIDAIAEHEEELLKYATERLLSIPGLKIYGTAPHKVSLISFLLNNIHPYDTGMILDKLGIAVRTGTHCTEPVMQHFGISGTVRVSFGLYNTTEEIDRLYDALLRVKQMFE